METRTHVVRYATHSRDTAILESLLGKGWDVAARVDVLPQSVTFILRRRHSLWARLGGLFRKKAPSSWALKRNV